MDVNADFRIAATLDRLVDKLRIREHKPLLEDYLNTLEVSPALQTVMDRDEWVRKAMDVILDAQLKAAAGLGEVPSNIRPWPGMGVIGELGRDAIYGEEDAE